MSENRSHVIETTDSSFQADAIERSREVPVVVDFWAEWCGPCRRLGPILENLAREYEGQFVLVKADTERCPGVAAGFGVRSIPAVFGLRNGKVVDSFLGALPEPAIRQWLDRLMPTPAERLVDQARDEEARDGAAAERLYRDSLELAPHDPAATVGLARVLLATGRVDEARVLVESLESRGFLEPEAERLKAELALRGSAASAGAVETAQAALAAAPDDPERQRKLAEALAAASRYDEALEICLRLVENDRKGVGESARKTMLAIFQLLPADSELAADYRRKLSAALY